VILRLALLFTIVPTVELALLIFIGTQLGVVWTTLIVLVTGILGAWLAKREGAGMLRKLRADLQRGVPPARHIAEGVLVLVGGLLLITPGVLTDVAGLAMIIPYSRRILAPVLLRVAIRWVTGSKELAASFDLGGDEPPPPDAPPGRSASSPFTHPIPEPWSPPDDR
jgi:UPF0716 protein FxsA